MPSDGRETARAHPRPSEAKRFPQVENEKAARQLGQPFLSRENSSNGDQNRQNFLAKSYEPKKGSVKKYLGNKRLYFQWFTK
jgi:hypothetical protein